MNSEFKRYDSYYPVAYDYVRELPTGWKLLPNIAIFQERIERGFVNEELLSVTIKNGVVKQSEVEIKKDNSNEDKSNYKLVKKGDIAINKMRMWQGALGVSEYRGIVSPAYIVLKSKMAINSRYFHYLFRTSYYTNYSKRHSYGIVDDQLSLRYTHFKRMYSILPPIEIQHHVVSYLDNKLVKIESFIQSKERLIELTNEQKRTVIDKAVTRGLGPNGKTPPNWKLRRWKYVLNIRNGQVNPKKLRDEILLAPNHIESGTGRIVFKETSFEQSAESGKYEVKKNDVVYSKIRPELNKACIAEEDCLCSADMYAIHAKKGYDNEFLKYVFLSDGFCKAMVESSMRVAMPKVNREDVKNYRSRFPDLVEQRQIVEHIKRELEILDRIIEKAQKEISKIRNYGEALTTKAVTGNIDVTNSES